MDCRSIVAWNIQHGGGRKNRCRRILNKLEEFDADVLIITEFRNNAAGTTIKSCLAGLGYEISHPATGERANSVLIASREPIRKAYPLDESVADQRHLWVVEFGWGKLCAVYMPLDTAKLPYWIAMNRAANQENGPDIFIGDFNTGNNHIDLAEGATRFIASDHFDAFGRSRVKDVWRYRNPTAREYTWFSTRAKNGFRLDQVFAADHFIESVTSCEYLHDTRLAGLSDHSALRVEWRIPSNRLIAVVPEETTRTRQVIYAIQDPLRPDLVKIGKDSMATATSPGV